MHPWDAIWIFFILSSLQPLVQKQSILCRPGFLQGATFRAGAGRSRR